MPEHGIHAVVLVFEGLAQGDLKAQIEEVDEISWFSSADIAQLPLAYQHRNILNAYIFWCKNFTALNELNHICILMGKFRRHIFHPPFQ